MIAACIIPYSCPNGLQFVADASRGIEEFGCGNLVDSWPEEKTRKLSVEFIVSVR